MIDISSLIKNLRKNKNSKSHLISCDKLHLSYSKERGLIGWSGYEITGAYGFFSSFSVLDTIHYSFGAEWLIERENKSSLILRLRFKDIPLTQIWRFEMTDKNSIIWNVEAEFEENLVFDDAQAGLFVNGNYANWVNTYEEDAFLPIRGWQDMFLNNLESRIIGVRGFYDKRFFVPSLFIDFSENNSDLRPVIRNTSRDLNSRILAASFEGGEKKEGIYNFFNCRIELIDSEEKTDLFVEGLRNKLFKDRELGFIFS